MIEGFSIAFTADALAPSPTWTRLDDDDGLVASYSIRRGRQDELQKTGTGTAVVELNDTAGLFEPSNIASPFFGNLDGKQAGLALWNPVDEEWAPIFRGLVDGYVYEVDASGLVTRLQIELVDALDYLAGVELAPGTAGDTPPSPSEGDVFYENDNVDDRIRAILTDAQWPSELRTIFTGNVHVKSVVYPPGTTALAALQDAADAEFPGVANIYADKHNNVTFHGRLARFSPETVDPGTELWDWRQWRAGDGSITAVDTSYAQIRRLSFSRERKAIINAAMALPDRNGEKQLTGAEIIGQIVADDGPGQSIDKYGVRSWSAENLLTAYKLGEAGESPTNNDLTETKKFAHYYVDNYKMPATRVTQLGLRSIHPDDSRGPATWRLLCGVEISDEIRLKTSHPGGGFEDDKFYVEGISYDVNPLTGPWRGSDEEMHAGYADVTLTLDVSPRSRYSEDPF
jgi:hypothetical protein